MIGDGKAALRESVITYAFDGFDTVMLIKNGYTFFNTSIRTFNDLYFKLDHSRAALKEDCIDYAIHSVSRPIYTYPYWYIGLLYDELIFFDGYTYHGYTFYDVNNDEDIEMSEGSVILRNRKNEFRYMESNDFDRYYEL